MKKVILEEKKSEVYLSDLNDKSIIGAESSAGNKFIMSTTDSGIEFIGNNNVTSHTKTQYTDVKKALFGFYNIYLFDNAKECFKWMSE